MRRIKRQAVCLFLLILMSASAGCGKDEEQKILQEVTDLEKEPEDTKDQEEQPQEEQTIFVHICGQVARPGVYELARESRVYEAIAAAGGLLDTASEASVNQAERMEDGQKLYILSLEEASLQGNEAQQGTGQSAQVDGGKVSINTADKETLMSLTGIGETRADAILRYREEQGGFQSLEEIMQIEGIKEGIFEKIKEQIKL